MEIKAFDADVDLLDQAITDAFAEMTRLEALFSSHLPDIEISQLSVAAKPFTVSSETAQLLQLGQRIALQSGGAFDLTLGAVKQLWAIETDTPYILTAEQLQSALKGIGPKALQLEDHQVTKSIAGLQVDLGGIAKGYAVDRALAALKQAGVTSASVWARLAIRETCWPVCRISW